MVKDIDISNINKDFESRVRLGIMSILMVNEWVNFNDMKQMLELSDGNSSALLTLPDDTQFKYVVMPMRI